jgi:hypothetical protein
MNALSKAKNKVVVCTLLAMNEDNITLVQGTVQRHIIKDPNKLYEFFIKDVSNGTRNLEFFQHLL